MTDPESRTDLGLAFLGCGAIVGRHARTLGRRHRGIRRFYASRDSQRALAALQRHGGAGAFGSYDEALEDARVDVVFVATPPASHLELSLAALRAGKHVIVEKPAFLTPQDFDEVEEAARRADRRVLVAENYVHKPLCRALHDVVASGDLGKVRLVEVSAVKLQRAEGWRCDPLQAGGGALFEGGVHQVAFMTHLGLEPLAVHGSFAGSPPGHERSAVLTMEYAQGATGVLTYSWEIPRIFRGLGISRIRGTNGSALFESNGLFLARTGRRVRVTVPNPRDLMGQSAMWADIIRCIMRGESPLYTLTSARRDVALILQAYATASADSTHTEERFPWSS